MENPTSSRRFVTVSLLILAMDCGPALGQLGLGSGGVARIWEQNCLRCHGERGQGGGAGTSSLLDDDWLAGGSDWELFQSILRGHPDQGMEGFGETLTEPEVWSQVAYIHELRYADMRKRLGSPTPDAGGVYASTHERFRVETVTEEGLDVPWSLDFLPASRGHGERMLVANRNGELRVFEDGRMSAPVRGTPAVRNRGQGGLMEVAAHPRYAENGWIYLAFSDRQSREGRDVGMTKIVRGRIEGTRWNDEETVYAADGASYLPTDLHFGCRIAFDPKDPSILFFSIGERGRMEHAQDLSLPNGKVHRVHDDGRVPNDNPFVGREGALATIWSYGHRNPQGLVFDAEGRLWDTEHGPRGGDEVNLIERGANYGWPLVSFGINYNGAPFRTPWPGEGQEIAMPAFVWMPSIGACGLDVARGGWSGEMFPKWRGDLLAGGLSGENVDRIRLDASGKVVEREELIHGMGRVRDVSVGPDGSVYLVLNGPDRIVRLVRAE